METDWEKEPFFERFEKISSDVFSESHRMNIPAYFFAIIWIEALSIGLCLLAFVLTRRYRLFPIFFVYLSFLLTAAIVQAFENGRVAYWRTYLICSALDYLFELAVMWELTRHIVAFLNRDLYRTGKAMGLLAAFFFIVSGTIVAVGSDLHHVVIGSDLHHFARDMEQYLYLDSFFLIVRTLFFAALLSFSVILGLRWKHLPVRLTACLSFYSSIALAARATQIYGVKLSHLRLWFEVADIVPVLFWSVLMVIISLYCFSSSRYQPISEFSR